jgi:flagellar motility protein MotE (MotC chaperone)
MATKDLQDDEMPPKGKAPKKPAAKKAKPAKPAKPAKRAKGGKRKNGAAAAATSVDAPAKSGLGGIVFAIVSLLSALLIIAVVLAGSLFFAVRVNLFGITDTYREQLSHVPGLNMAVPKVIDTSEPENLEHDDLLIAYRLLEEERDAESARAAAAEEARDSAQADAAALRKYKDQADSQALVAKENQESIDKQRAQLEADKKKLEEMKYELERIAAQGDTEGFRQFFESVSPEVSQEIYAQIVKEQQGNDELKAFAKLYEGMDAASAASIFEQLGESRIDLIVSALRAMKRDRATEILSKMTPTFAAAVTVKLAA